MAFAVRSLSCFGFPQFLKHLVFKKPFLIASKVSVANRGFVSILTEVSEALKLGHPVVALESTIISHGMPYPKNLETALMVENVVRENGSVPATVALLGGKLHVGLTKAELEHIASSKSEITKTSRRDLAYVMSQKLDGGTTVSGTMIAAHMAGIKVFVTGGIGGVHRGAESTMDISADLTELGRTPVAVVCAGVKSILDIERTLEYLETEGVPVVTLGGSREFPAFFTSRSGFLSPYTLGSAEEVAQLIASHFSLKLSNGVLVAVPIPEQFALNGQEMEEVIRNAIVEANRSHISGKELTPFLLNAVNKFTSGRSLEANVELIRNNAAIGSQIACHLAKLSHRPSSSSQLPTEETSRINSIKIKQRSDCSATAAAARTNESSVPSSQCSSKGGATEKLTKRIVVLGGINFDMSMTLAGSSTSLKTNGVTHRGRMRHSFGGVGRNIADCLSRLGMAPLFISAVGDDWMGKHFRECFSHMDMSGVAVSKQSPTAVYSAVLSPSGELLYGIGDFEIHKEVSANHIKMFESEIRKASLVCLDGCISAEAIDFITDFCHQSNIPILFEPTDVNQIEKLFSSNAWKKLTYISPNISELQVIHHFVKVQQNLISSKVPTDFVRPHSLTHALDFCQPLCTSVSEYIPNIILTMGKHGMLLCKQGRDTGLDMHCTNDQALSGSCAYYEKDGNGFLYHPAIWPGFPEPRIKSVLGAGDCLAATLIAAMQIGLPMNMCIRLGILAARKSLESFEAVPETITPELLTITSQQLERGLVS